MSDTIRTTEQIIADMIAERDGVVDDIAEEIADKVVRQQSPTAQLDGVGRQFGLTARAGLEGAASIVDLVQAPIAATMNMALGTDYKPLREQVSTALTSIGVPEPEDGYGHGGRRRGRYRRGVRRVGHRGGRPRDRAQDA